MHCINAIDKQKPNDPKSLFKNFGIWPTTVIMSYFSPTEVIELGRVNREARYISKKVYQARTVNLERINIKSVKFFERAEEIRITQDSLVFFQQFKDNFFEEVLEHYTNLLKVSISLNFLFDERVKDQLFEKLSKFTLRQNIITF